MPPNPPPATPVSERSAPGEAVDTGTDPMNTLLNLVRRIWEDKAIGLISTAYVHNAVLHVDDAEYHGREAVMERAVRTLAAFPDLRLYGHDLIGGHGPDGLHTSHLVTSSAHHQGHGEYGPPTGRRVHWRSGTQRLVVGGRVVEEWSVHDELAILRQLGLDAWALARAAASLDARPPVSGGEVVRGRGQEAPLVPAESSVMAPEALPGHVAAMAWNARRLDVLPRLYAPDATLRAPGQPRLHGPAAVAHHVLEWLAVFPDGAMHIDHVTGDGTGPDTRVAARWTFLGTHTGSGRYGPPTGRRVRVPGLTHLHIAEGRIQREDTVWNGFALLRQLAAPAGP